MSYYYKIASQPYQTLPCAPWPYSFSVLPYLRFALGAFHRPNVLPRVLRAAAAGVGLSETSGTVAVSALLALSRCSLILAFHTGRLLPSLRPFFFGQTLFIVWHSLHVHRYSIVQYSTPQQNLKSTMKDKT